MEITGSTTVFAIAADPIAHVKTPQRLNALLRERGIDAVMVPFHVAAAGLPGLFAGLRGQGHEPAGRHVYLAGLGGAGKAIACAIAEAGPASLRLYNRSPGKAEAFAARLARHYPGLAISVADPRPEACDIAINATTLGLDDNDPLPFQLDALAPGAVVADAVMSRVDTPLLRAAAARGCRTHPGLYMLEGQLTEIARFLGIEKPQQELLNALA